MKKLFLIVASSFLIISFIVFFISMFFVVVCKIERVECNESARIEVEAFLKECIKNTSEMNCIFKLHYSLPQDCEIRNREECDNKYLIFIN